MAAGGHGGRDFQNEVDLGVSGVGGGRAQLGRRCLLQDIEENMATESQRPTRPVDGRSPAIVARWFIHVYPCLSMFIHVYPCLSMFILLFIVANCYQLLQDVFHPQYGYMIIAVEVQQVETLKSPL